MQFHFRAVIVQLEHREQTVQRPTQAVILAGGRGTRLRPLTDVRPKPMIEMHGKPFLEYLVEMLREQGLDQLASNVTFITGPSKTGDIELQLTTGVHGPGKWRVIVVDGGAQETHSS